MGNKESATFREIDTLWQTALARMTRGISPAGASAAYYAWTAHLAQAPGKMLEIASYPVLNTQEFIRRMNCERGPACDTDPRFKSKSWDFWPWRLHAETFLMMEKWAEQAARDVPGLDDHEERVAAFTVRQLMDALCPANFPMTNPDVFQETLANGGANLVHGAWNALDDFQHILSGLPVAESSAHKVGENLAVTPGEVVFRNNLIELIRYTPQTKTVYKEPVLVLPAWIMKYYILDLSPHNSLARWLVEQGHTVFMVSWKNPDAEDRDLGMDDYYRLGAMAAIDEVGKSVQRTKIHLTGYCLGGTLAMIAAAALAQKGDHRLKTLSLFAAQGDFSDAGELRLFVTHSQVAFLKNIMKVQGYLDTKQMAGAFQMLRSYDLIWSKIVSDYLHGRRRSVLDLMVWNEDATRMPCRMHSEYLDRLFLHNDFAEGRFAVESRPVAPRNIDLPIFAVATENDHVAPWRSVYKVHTLLNGSVTFALTTGGHNAGIVSEPGHPHRSYRIRERKPREHHTGTNNWLDLAEQKEGSWWPAWQEWLVRHSSKEKTPPPPPGQSLGPAPGHYVFQK